METDILKLKKELNKILDDYRHIKEAQENSDKGEHPARDLGFYDEEYGIQCLSDHYIVHSLHEFKSSVQSGGYICSDGCGELLYVNKHTFQLIHGDDCWDINWEDDIEKIVKDHSNEDRLLFGVMWYNK